MQKEKIMYRLRNMTFLLTIISCLTVKTIQTQRTITTTVVIIIIAARIATTAATTTMAIQPNISVITISSLAITAAAAVAAAATPRTTTIATPRTINNVTITHLETPTTAATAITAQYKNAILILPTIKTTIINSTNSIKQIADASINMNSSVNGSENANPYANVNQNVNANVNIFLPGTYQAYAQQQQQQQQIQQQQRQQQQQIQQKRPTTIKKSIIGKGLKLPLTILTKQQQQHAIFAIAQTIQKPFQTLFGILNRNPASLSTLGNATATATSTSTSTATSNAMALNTTLYACSCRCGERNDETRIVGGSTTLPNEYPWMARLSYFNRFYCGGTLINDRYILTAAHCIKGFMWFMIKVTFGEHDRCKIKERPETRFVLRAFTQKFSFANFDNDIALLRLNDRVPITNFIKPICLPRFKERDNQFVGIKAIATGWGTLKEDGKPSCVLQEVIVPVLDNRACVEQTNYTQKMITKNMLCAGYPGKGEKDSCQGDSGGPLIRIRPDDQRYEQIGIVSWGNGCARPNYPGVYTRITKYLDWIIENSKDGCFCQDGI